MTSIKVGDHYIHSPANSIEDLYGIGARRPRKAGISKHGTAYGHISKPPSRNDTGRTMFCPNTSCGHQITHLPEPNCLFCSHCGWTKYLESESPTAAQEQETLASSMDRGLDSIDKLHDKQTQRDTSNRRFHSRGNPRSYSRFNKYEDGGPDEEAIRYAQSTDSYIKSYVEHKPAAQDTRFLE